MKIYEREEPKKARTIYEKMAYIYQMKNNKEETEKYLKKMLAINDISRGKNDDDWK